MEHIEFEKKVIEMLLEGDHPLLSSLRNQYSNSQIISREFTGVGFFTCFIVKQDFPKVIPLDFTISDLGAGFKQESVDILFNLFVRNGFLSCLEGYTVSRPNWPEDYSKLYLHYCPRAEKRDINKFIF
jgi:hypothetical protein